MCILYLFYFIFQCFFSDKSYVAVLVWIPELFSRYYDFKKRNPDGANLCTASEWLLKHNNKTVEKTVSSEAYVAALIVASTTIPLIILTGIAVKYLNKKILLCTFRYRVFKYTRNWRNVIRFGYFPPFSRLGYKFLKVTEKKNISQKWHTIQTKIFFIYNISLTFGPILRILLQESDTWWCYSCATLRKPWRVLLYSHTLYLTRKQ